jgi:hypothetical protein
VVSREVEDVVERRVRPVAAVGREQDPVEHTRRVATE